MPRRARYAPTGCTFHVTNRGNDRRRLFFEDVDYQRFIALLARAKGRHPVRLFGLCLMPNHFHALVRPEEDGALAAYFHWVEGCYAGNFRWRTETLGNGHVFKERYWSDGILDDLHFLNVLKYIEANPVVAKLVARAEDWPWSSATLRYRPDGDFLDPLPWPLPLNWFDLLNDGETVEREPF
jgi:putative transposase